MALIFNHRYLIARRLVQVGLLALFFGANHFGWTLMKGNYSSALLFETVPMSDPYAVLQIFTSGLIISIDILIGAVIVLLIYGLLFGRIFCSWICPMNIIADIAIWLNNKFDFKSSLTFSRKTRYGLVVLGLILSPILGYAAFEAISPISMLHRGVIFGFGLSWTIIGSIFLFDLAITKYGWCGHLCPLGAFYSVTGKFSLLKVKHIKDNCTSCMKCFQVCPEEQVLHIVTKVDGYIKSGECTNCARCIEVCHDKALKFSIRKPILRN